MERNRLSDEKEKAVDAAVRDVFATRVPLEYQYLAASVLEAVLSALRGHTTRH
jgi:hypothetical protein